MSKLLGSLMSKFIRSDLLHIDNNGSNSPKAVEESLTINLYDPQNFKLLKLIHTGMTFVLVLISFSGLQFCGSYTLIVNNCVAVLEDLLPLLLICRNLDFVFDKLFKSEVTRKGLPKLSQVLSSIDHAFEIKVVMISRFVQCTLCR